MNININLHSSIIVVLLVIVNKAFPSLHEAISRGESTHYECHFDGGRISDCRAIGTNSSGKGNGGDSHGLVLGRDDNGKIFISKYGDCCTKSEVLDATVIFGDWTKQNQVPGIPRDLFLEGVITTGIIYILKLFHNNDIFKTGFKSSRFDHLRLECAMEYITHACRLEKVTHPCFKKFNPNNYPEERPVMHYSEEDKKKQLEKSKDPILNELRGHR